jgi:hypothetical protein
MKLTRKQFIKRSLLTAAGISMAPKIMGMFKMQPILEKRMLGNTGIELTALGFGASRTQEAPVLRAALERGITFLDTGRSYANGQNEEMIGKVLKGIRSKYVIQSKMKVEVEDNTSPRKIRRQMEESLQASLDALQTNYIDIMLLHGIRENKYIKNDTIREVFTEMKKKGKIRACGFSSHTNHVELLHESNKDHFFDVVMVPFNPSGTFKHSRSNWSTSWDQEALIKEMKIAHQNGTGIIAMKTCSGGKYSYNQADSPSYPGAVQWVLAKEFIHAAAVAMANFEEIDQHSKAC